MNLTVVMKKDFGVTTEIFTEGSNLTQERVWNVKHGIKISHMKPISILQPNLMLLLTETIAETLIKLEIAFGAIQQMKIQDGSIVVQFMNH